MTFLDSEAKDEHGHKRWRDQGPHNLQPHVFIMEIMKQDFVLGDEWCKSEHF
jgi:hypothetical protein